LRSAAALGSATTLRSATTLGSTAALRPTLGPATRTLRLRAGGAAARATENAFVLRAAGRTAAVSIRGVALVLRAALGTTAAALAASARHGNAY
jgi:hypothetical protein